MSAATKDLLVGVAMGVTLCLGLYVISPEAKVGAYVVVGLLGLLGGTLGAVQSRAMRRLAYGRRRD